MTAKYRFIIVNIEDEGVFGTNDPEKLQEFIDADIYEVIDIATGKRFYCNTGDADVVDLDS